MGLAFIRFVWRIEPLASMDDDEVVLAVAPTIQRYLTGEIADPDRDRSTRHAVRRTDGERASKPKRSKEGPAREALGRNISGERGHLFVTPSLGLSVRFRHLGLVVRGPLLKSPHVSVRIAEVGVENSTHVLDTA
jgi:hypothetical protein